MTDATNPTKTPAELHDLARQAVQEENYAAAEQYLNAAFTHNPNDAVALALMANIHEGRGDLWRALQEIARAIRLNHTELTYKQQFLRLARNLNTVTYDPDIDAALLVCLQTPDLEWAGANILWGTMLMLLPRYRQLFGYIHWRGFISRTFFGAKVNPFVGIKNFDLLLEPYFLQGIRKNVVHQQIFEQFMVFLRSFLLDQVTAAQPKLAAEDYLALTAAVAQYAFHTDYILDVTAHEQSKVDALRIQIESGGAPPISLALLACYLPLYRLHNAETAAQKFAAIPELVELIQEQITEYLALQRQAQAIPVLTPVDDAVSEKVRAQYEEFPYPRWREMETTQSGTQDITRMSRLNATIFTCLTQPQAQALVAGCGTGRESSHLAAAFPTTNILAIDITRTSLAYAASKAVAYNLKNITFGQADILRLENLGRQFNYISCFGVLHHMREPETGWAVLTCLLKPGGLMNIGLYSATARRVIVEARAVIAKGNYAPTPEGMRQFRKDSPKLLRRSTLRALTHMSDYYYLNMYRDLLFNVQEERFDIPRIKADLKTLGLQFEGFKVPPPVVKHYRQLFPDDPTGVNLDHWHSYEQANPDTFLECYAFWCRKPAQ